MISEWVDGHRIERLSHVQKGVEEKIMDAVDERNFIYEAVKIIYHAIDSKNVSRYRLSFMRFLMIAFSENVFFH